MGWKSAGRTLPVKSVNLDGFDYDMQMKLTTVPVVTVTKRCSSILRSGHQLRLAKLKGQIEQEAKNRELNQSFINQMDLVKAEYQAQLKTKSDEKRLEELAQTLQGWELREAELTANVQKIDDKIDAMKAEELELLNTNLNGVEEWTFNLDEIK